MSAEEFKEILMRDCFDKSGHVIAKKWIERRDHENAFMMSLCPEPSVPIAPKIKNKRLRRGFYSEDLSKWVDPNPKASSWYVDYILSNKCSTVAKFKRKFRRRFRMTRDSFLDFLATSKKEAWFADFGLPDCTGRSVPVERYLGRGWTFDDLEEDILP
jgi:hypothetical protein